MQNFTIDKKEINKLVKLIGMGNSAAYERLYSKMHQVIYYFLLRYSLNIDDIEDVISSTFLIVIEKSRSKMSYKNCFSWILTIAKYQLFNLNRQYEKLSFDDEIIDRFAIEYDTNKLSLKFDIDKLSKTSKQILYFVYQLEMPLKQVAQLLDMSLSTLQRRKKEIIKYLEEKYDER